MRHWLVIFALLFSPALCAVAHEEGAPATKPTLPPPSNRGQKNGTYTLRTAGDYSGTGNASVSDSVVSLYVELEMADGSKVSLSFNNMPRANDRFRATTTYAGVTYTISGRVDLPAATDMSQTADQAQTGRVTALIVDSNGTGARIVAVQDESSRSPGPL
jgi:hypothetical protein